MLKEVEDIYFQMMQALLASEKVRLLVPDEKTGQRILSFLRSKNAATQNLFFHKIKTVDTWIRDYGPIFVKQGKKIVFTKFTFNAWGGKYKDLARDNGVVDRVDYLKKNKRVDVPMVFEGGSIDVNGRGICLTTEQCLLNPNRNPHLSRKDIENHLKKYLGFRQIIWLKEGIEGDDTDGHVDDITRFVAPDTILTAMENDVRDKNHDILKENLDILKSSRETSGKKFNIVEFPMPGRVEVRKGHSSSGRLPASYANFYIANKTVLLPVYGRPHDRQAEQILCRLFPDRKVVPVECTALVYGLGSIHCVTQQQPR
jgi:agmatine deiminase